MIVRYKSYPADDTVDKIKRWMSAEFRMIKSN